MVDVDIVIGIIYIYIIYIHLHPKNFLVATFLIQISLVLEFLWCFYNERIGNMFEDLDLLHPLLDLNFIIWGSCFGGSKRK